jgi:putative transposase
MARRKFEAGQTIAHLQTIRVDYQLKSEQVLEVLASLFVTEVIPDYIRSDNGAEFAATEVRQWLAKVGVKTVYFNPSSPWENGFNERFNGSLRDELLNGEIFYTLMEARTLIKQWRCHYNEVRPHSSLQYQPPAPKAIIPSVPGLAACFASLHSPLNPVLHH